MNIESAIHAAFRGPAVSNLTVRAHPLDVSPMAIVHEDGVTVAQGKIAHCTDAGTVERLCYRLEVKHHRLVGLKRWVEGAGAAGALAHVASPWLGSAEHLIALFAQRLAADPDFDRIEIAFPHTTNVE